MTSDCTRLLTTTTPSIHGPTSRLSLVPPGTLLTAVGATRDEEEEEEHIPDATAECDDTPLPPYEAGLFRGVAARALYLSLDRPDMSFASKELCRRMSSPVQGDIQRLRRICQYMRAEPRLVYFFAWQEAGQPIKAYVDTDFAGCARTRKSTSGGALMLGSHLVKHWSTTQKTVTLSSGEAELGGVVKGVGEGLGLQALLTDLGYTPELEVHADSAAAIGICRRSGIGKVRHLAVGQLWVQERLREQAFRLYKVAGDSNPGDLLTKHLARDVIEKHLDILGLQRRTGRPPSAPSVTAEVRGWLGYGGSSASTSSASPSTSSTSPPSLSSTLCAVTASTSKKVRFHPKVLVRQFVVGRHCQLRRLPRHRTALSL